MEWGVNFKGAVGEVRVRTELDCGSLAEGREETV